ncbi:MAG TPA: hypothetical protein VNP73_09645 [Actinomycetota bacterium]|nr:hypothetical protein [Actinomycetota bacterium]
MTTESQQIQSDPQDAPTGTISAIDPPPSSGSATPAPRRKRLARLRQFVGAGAGVWVGLFLVAGGFGLIAYTWGEVAGLLDVALQLPFLVSGGLTALGLILLGLLVVNIAVKRKDALERQRQLEEVREALVRLREAIESQDED